MNVLLKCVQFLYSVYAMLVFIALMLVIFPFGLMASPFGKIRGGNIIYRLCCVLADAWFLLIGMRSKKIYTAAPPVAGTRYIFVANHISYVDVPMIVKVIRQP
jgi:1-acyl-sn-glycerol-3-phosphate acyltransferase